MTGTFLATVFLVVNLEGGEHRIGMRDLRSCEVVRDLLNRDAIYSVPAKCEVPPAPAFSVPPGPPVWLPAPGDRCNSSKPCRRLPRFNT